MRVSNPLKNIPLFKQTEKRQLARVIGAGAEAEGAWKAWQLAAVEQPPPEDVKRPLLPPHYLQRKRGAENGDRTAVRVSGGSARWEDARWENIRRKT